MISGRFPKMRDASQDSIFALSRMGWSRPIGNRCQALAWEFPKFVFTPESSTAFFYIAKFYEAIYVLHAFQKDTRKTNKADIDLAKRRLSQLIRDRQLTREPKGR
jgi:hypothetical protein